MRGVHVMPVGDLIGHEDSVGCPCVPACEAVFRDDGSSAWLYTHHSLDGREREERQLGFTSGGVRWEVVIDVAGE